MTASSSSTTLSNYVDHKKGIDVPALPLTFQDAIEVTRKLEFRYLGVDVLCIIQYSEEDWSREASNMTSILECSWLNIAAAGSDQDDGRLIMEREPLLNQPCKLPSTLFSLPGADAEQATLPIYAYLDSLFYAKSVLEGILDHRAWIMQERILSPLTASAKCSGNVMTL